MKTSGWISTGVCLLIVCLGAGAAEVLHGTVPARLTGTPLLASAQQSQAGKPLKDVIFQTQKRVVTLEAERGQGSGFLYNRDGDVVTNAHVVAGSVKVKVTTADARELTGTVIGISESVDVAVVRVPALKGADPLPINRNAKAEVGDAVMAVGSPLGLQSTVTTGAISGVGRSFNIAPYVYSDLYQISAPIAPGNSGGPLVDERSGIVLGINSAEMEKGQIGFSIPIVDVLDMVEGWSRNPMKTLPGVSGGEDGQQEGEGSGGSDGSGDTANVPQTLTDHASYLVSHFYDSLNNGDYVYAYSLLGSDWKAKTTYEKFRAGYLPTQNVTILDSSVEDNGDGTATVTAVIQAEEHAEGEDRTRKFRVTYTVGNENDQLKLLSGKGKELPDQ